MVNYNPFQKWATALGMVVLSTSAFADTVTLKNGDKIEGKIITESDKEVVIEERISASITDNRTIPKGDVAKIDKQSQDEPAYQAIKNLKPGPNSLPAASYDQITKSLNNFVTSFPQSSHAAEVKEQVTAWEEEKKRVDGGEVKLGNKWLSKDEAQKERYQINGQVILNYMQQQYRQGDLTGALNSFDQMERNYPGARAYPDAVELAKQILPTLKSTAERTLQNAKFQQAEREKGIQLLSDTQRAETVAALQREQQQADAAVEAANKAGLKWPPLLARSEKALTTITGKIPEEQRRLAEIPVSKLRESIKMAEQARTQIQEKKFDDAEKSLRDSLELWNANELATRLQTEANTQRTAQTNTPAPEEAPQTTPPPNAADTASSTPSSDSPTPNADSNANADASANASEEEEKPFFKTPAGFVTLLIVGIVVLTGISAFRKIRKRAGEVIE